MSAVTMMSVGEILRRANSSGDLGSINNAEDWFGILAGKVSHDHFDWLCDKIDDEGFTIPIVIGTHEDYDGEIAYTIGNGHHRLCAAILLGIDSIPVILTSSGFVWNDDSHDGNMDPGTPSYEYWELLRGNMEGDHYGDTDAKAWRYQYVTGDNESDENGCDCDDCNRPSSYCWDCQSTACVCNEECDNCGLFDHLHAPGCTERAWSVVNCGEHGFMAHYRMHAPECTAWIAEQRVQADAEHIARGFLPVGAWHPAGVLTEAYEEHDEYMRDEALKAARELWQVELTKVRDAATRGVGDYALAHYVEAANAAFEAYAAL